MCNCGCNTCETKGPLLTEGKVKSLLSEGLQYHIDKIIEEISGSTEERIQQILNITNL